MIYWIELNKDLWSIHNWFITAMSFVRHMSQAIGKESEEGEARSISVALDLDRIRTFRQSPWKRKIVSTKSKNVWSHSSNIKWRISGSFLNWVRFLHLSACYSRFAFPFGRPEGGLKATLSLLERVLAKDIATPISRDDIRNFIGKCLENAAYINYTRVSDQAKIEGKS